MATSQDYLLGLCVYSIQVKHFFFISCFLVWQKFIFVFTLQTVIVYLLLYDMRTRLGTIFVHLLILIHFIKSKKIFRINYLISTYTKN